MAPHLGRRRHETAKEAPRRRFGLRRPRWRPGPRPDDAPEETVVVERRPRRWKGSPPRPKGQGRDGEIRGTGPAGPGVSPRR